MEYALRMPGAVLQSERVRRYVSGRGGVLSIRVRDHVVG
jgi:hypothetical protein